MDRNENIPKSFCYRTFLEKVNECFLVCFAQRAVSDRILKRKEFVAIRLWRNLKWKFLSLVLIVHILESK